MAFEGAARQCADCGWVVPSDRLPAGVTAEQALVRHSDYCAAPGFP
jgi:ribosomal protein L37E